ncbi:hypothetical protein BD309DRAFT_959541 [Dichomitus squalens]|nr:hypothetical protein BD309DRAFT_959541 [Dichomitus squalens]
MQCSQPPPCSLPRPGFFRSASAIEASLALVVCAPPRPQLRFDVGAESRSAFRHVLEVAVVFQSIAIPAALRGVSPEAAEGIIQVAEAEQTCATAPSQPVAVRTFCPRKYGHAWVPLALRTTFLRRQRSGFFYRSRLQRRCMSESVQELAEGWEAYRSFIAKPGCDVKHLGPTGSRGHVSIFCGCL